MKKIFIIAILILIWFHAENLQSQDFYGINPVNRLYSNWGREYSGTSSGDTLFFVVEEERFQNFMLHIVDCQDHENIHEIGCCPFEIPDYSCMKARTNILYIAHGAGLSISILGQNLSLQVLAEFNLEQGCTAVELMGDYALLGGGDGRMIIMNISDPANPEISAAIDLGYAPTQIKISGSTCYVTGDRFTIISIENPENPEVISTTNRSGLDLEIINETACIAIGDNGLRFYDISDPGDPFETGHLRNSSYRLEQIDGFLLSGHQIITEEFWVGPNDYVEYDVSNCWLIDVSNPFVPVTINRAGWCYGNLFTAVGGMITQFYGDPGSWYLTFHSIHQNGRLVPAGRLNPPQLTTFVTGEGDKLYALNGDDLVILDTSNPEYLTEVSRLNLEDNHPYELYFGNERVYFCDRSGRVFRSVNVSDPLRPRLTEFIFEAPFNLGYHSFRTYMDNLIIPTTADGRSGIFIVSTDPDNPAETFFQLFGEVYMPPAIVDNYMYVPARSDGVIIFDISEISHPREIGRFEVACDAWRLDAEDDLLCVSDGNLNVFNIEDRENPELLSVVDTPDTTTIVQMKYGYIYTILANSIGTREPFIHIVDLTDPANPVSVAHGETYSRPRNIYLIPPYIYTSERNALGIYECSEVVGVNHDREESAPQTTTLYPAYPNPFNSFTSLKYNLTKPASVQIGIFDTHGRQVLDITNHQLRYPGIHTEIINANSLPSGSYYAFLKVGDLQEVAPLILIK
ncbi:MAG: hypothetical protein HN757_15640 [Calditrichaeota bacterium]|nr:hypothetical protein [Calditrichota bacterium]